MSTKNTTIIVSILIVLAALAGVLFWNQLPDPMASHWGANDQVNGTTSKLLGVFLLPLITAALFGLFMLIPSIDPLKANINKFRGVYNLFIVLLTAFMLYVHGLQLVWNLGSPFRMSTALLPALGLLFIFLGFMIEKTKRNFFIGIRTPWTLSSDTVWDETHRVGGQLFKVSGVLALVGIFFPGYTLWFILVPVLGSALFSVVYSYVLFEREAKAA
jgi:uncharacterized membrane protein